MKRIRIEVSPEVVWIVAILVVGGLILSSHLKP